MNSIESFYGLLRGQKLVVIGNAPSLNSIDLTVLKSTKVITVSNGHKIKGFNSYINPIFHLIPNISYHNQMTPLVASAWVKEIEQSLSQECYLIMSYKDCGILLEHGHGFLKEVFCVNFSGQECPQDNFELPDLSKSFPPVWSVSIMALLFGLYLKPSSIGFVGIDHDWFIKKKYEYAFTNHLTRGLDPSVDPSGSIKGKMLDELPVVFRLFRQYRYVSKVSDQLAIPIYNCSGAGAVDEFDCIGLEKYLTL